MNKVTVFTPTYNRAELLPRLYESLREQTAGDFEWVVVDDGSTDNTEELVKKWRKEKNVFKIVYKKQRNGGKHRAINRGVVLASGDMFFIVDSDDYLKPDAVAWIKTVEKDLPDTGFVGLAGVKVGPDKKVIGKSFSQKPYVDATILERRKYNIIGDKAEVFYTDALRAFPFPEISGENFLDEALVWNRIASMGKIRWFNKQLYISEYLSDGLTKGGSRRHKDSPLGYRLFMKELIGHPEVGVLRRLGLIGVYMQELYGGKNWQKVATDLGVPVSSVFLGHLAHMVREKIK